MRIINESGCFFRTWLSFSYVNALIKPSTFYDRKDSDVRADVVWALGKIQDPRSVNPLIAALKDSDKNVRSRAARALGQIRDGKAIDPLCAPLRDSEYIVQIHAALALI